MYILVLFGVLFLCGLINSIIYISPTKFMPYLKSLYLKFCLPATPKAPQPPTTNKAHPNKEELSLVFSTFDKNGDGFITQQELMQSLENLGLFTSEKHIASMVEKFDANGDGLIDVNEFCELYQEMERGEGERGGGEGGEGDDLREAFNVFDENGDGLISVDELRLVLSSLGLMRSVGECKDMIEKVDVDGDGMVNFEEFARMMKSGRTIPIS